MDNPKFWSGTASWSSLKRRCRKNGAAGRWR